MASVQQRTLSPEIRRPNSSTNLHRARFPKTALLTESNNGNTTRNYSSLPLNPFLSCSSPWIPELHLSNEDRLDLEANRPVSIYVINAAIAILRVVRDHSNPNFGGLDFIQEQQFTPQATTFRNHSTAINIMFVNIRHHFIRMLQNQVVLPFPKRQCSHLKTKPTTILL